MAQSTLRHINDLGTGLLVCHARIPDQNLASHHGPVVLDLEGDHIASHGCGHDGILLVDAIGLGHSNVGNLDRRLAETVGRVRFADRDAGNGQVVSNVVLVGGAAGLALGQVLHRQSLCTHVKVDGHLGVTVVARGRVCHLRLVGDHLRFRLGFHGANLLARGRLVGNGQELGALGEPHLAHRELNVVDQLVNDLDGTFVVLVGQAGGGGPDHFLELGHDQLRALSHGLASVATGILHGGDATGHQDDEVRDGETHVATTCLDVLYWFWLFVLHNLVSKRTKRETEGSFRCLREVVSVAFVVAAAVFSNFRSTLLNAIER